MNHLHKLLWLLVILLLLAVGAVAVHKAWPLLFPEIAQLAAADPSCDLHQGPCQLRFADGGEVTFAITPRSIPVLTPIQLEVQLNGIAASRVEVDLAGVSMDMGLNRPQLTAQAKGSFSGTTRLPVCVRNRMDWEARVLLYTSEGIAAAPFHFSTYRDSPGSGEGQ